VKKLIFVISILAVFALSIAAFAYTQGRDVKTADSCCMGDSCPMKQQMAGNPKKGSCCDKCNGDSCPMKKQVENKSGTAAAAELVSQNVVVATGDGCCGCSCCGSEKKSSSKGV